MASMDYSEATNARDMLEKELQDIYKLPTSVRITLVNLPELVDMEIHRLSYHIGDATEQSDIRIPVDGESMLSNIPAEFGLSCAEATEKFKQKLKSELKELMKSDARFPFTSEFVRKVINHTKAYLKKQHLHECAVFGPRENQNVEMEYYVAKQKRDRLQEELNIIRSRVRPVDHQYMLRLMDAEIQRLSHDIGNAILSLKHHSEEIKIPVEGAMMLPRVPDEYGLSSAAETKQFIKCLRDELEWVMGSDEQFPLTFQFIQRVISHAERYMMEKRPFEVAVFGRTA